MKVETPYRDFLAFWARAEGAPRDEQVRLWEELYAGPHRALVDYYLGLFGGSLGDALERFGEVAGTLDERFAALQLEAQATEVARLLDAPQPPRAYAMVGLFTADAWSDDHDGETAAFFALESAPRTAVLAAHEFAHASHRLARDEYWSAEPGLILLAEGLAIATSMRLWPGAALEEHFGVEGYERWEAGCDAERGRAVDAMLACLDTADLRQVKRFFWPDWGREDRDLPARVGYLLAARVTRALLGEHDLAAIARWPAGRALPEVRAALETLR